MIGGKLCLITYSAETESIVVRTDTPFCGDENEEEEALFGLIRYSLRLRGLKEAQGRRGGDLLRGEWSQVISAEFDCGPKGEEQKLSLSRWG